MLSASQMQSLDTERQDKKAKAEWSREDKRLGGKRHFSKGSLSFPLQTL